MTKVSFRLFEHKKTGEQRVMLSKVTKDGSSSHFVFNASEWKCLGDIQVEGLSRLKEMTLADLQEALSEGLAD